MAPVTTGVEGFLILSQIGHAVAALAFGWLVFVSYRYVQRRSTAVGAIFAIAILVRATIGLALFWISYLQLPIAEPLQLGGGFWQPALDATGYFQLAANAATAHTLVALDHVVPAPFFVNVLALWMMAVGISPAAGMFLNLCLYVTLVVLLVRFFAPLNDRRRDLPCIVAVAAYSFWPVILFDSTQPLKDELFSVLVAVLCLGVLNLRHLVHSSPSRRHPWAVVTGVIMVGVATFGSAAIRWYYPFIALFALGLVLCAFAVLGRTTPLPRYLAGSVVVIIAAWLGFWGGAGPHYRLLGANIAHVNQIVRLPYDLALFTQIARAGFLTGGGETNVVFLLREDSSTGRTHLTELEQTRTTTAAYAEGARQRAAELARLVAQRRAAELARLAAQRRAAELARLAAQRRAEEIERLAAQRRAAEIERIKLEERIERERLEAEARRFSAGRAIAVNIVEHLRAIGTGLALVFVPVSALRAVSNVEVAGGRGMLPLVDLDTVYMDIAIFFVLALVWKRRHAIGVSLPFVVFGLILSATTAVMLGYVVTNFGTIWRMRPLIAIPLWVLVVALSPRPGTGREAPDIPSRPSAVT